MEENILNISDSSYGEYADKLSILDKNGFDKFIRTLQNECV